MQKNRLFDYLTEKVTNSPDLPFLSDKKYKNSEAYWQNYSYLETEQYAQRFATALLNLGIKKGDMIGISANNRPEWNFVDIGCQYIGAVLVPLYPLRLDIPLACLNNSFKSSGGLFSCLK